MKNATIDEMLAVISHRSMCNDDPEKLIQDAAKNSESNHSDSPPTRIAWRIGCDVDEYLARIGYKRFMEGSCLRAS